MKFLDKIIKSKWGVVISLMCLAFLVRAWKMEYTPFPTDADELAYIFTGQSLIDYGRPIAWSSFRHEELQWQYRPVHTDSVSEGVNMEFINPWFDHTFLLPLMIGSWSELGGYTFPSIPPALWYRIPMLLLASISLLFVYLITEHIWGHWAGVWSLILLGFSPGFVIIQRMVVPENLMIVFMLWAFYLFLKKQPVHYIVMAAALAGLVKVTGLVIVPILVLGWLFEKQYLKATVFAISTMSIVLMSLAWYGMSVDFSIFLDAMQGQSARLIGWVNPTYLLSNPGFHTIELLDFSYFVILFCSIAAWISTKQTKESKLVLVAIIAAWCTVWVTSAEQDMLGWYKIPLFTFFGIASGAIMQTKQWKFLIVMMGFVFLTNLGIIRYPLHPFPNGELMRGVVALFLIGSSMLIYTEQKEKYYQRLLTLLVVLFIGQSFFIADQFFDARCRDRHCPTPLVTPKTVLKSVLQR